MDSLPQGCFYLLVLTQYLDVSLLLEPTHCAPGQYRRVGVVELYGGKHPRRLETVSTTEKLEAECYKEVDDKNLYTIEII